MTKACESGYNRFTEDVARERASVENQHSNLTAEFRNAYSEPELSTNQATQQVQALTPYMQQWPSMQTAFQQSAEQQKLSMQRTLHSSTHYHNAKLVQ